jgi:hypothetical protein
MSFISFIFFPGYYPYILLSHIRSNVRKHCDGGKKNRVEFLMDLHDFRTPEYEIIVFLNVCLY